MYCKQCGKEIRDNSSFCGACGTSVERTASTVAMPTLITSNVGAGQNLTSSSSKPKLSVFAKVESAILMVIIVVSLIGMFNFPLVKVESILGKKIYASFVEVGDDEISDIIREMIIYDPITGILTFIMMIGIVICLILTVIAIIKLVQGKGKIGCKKMSNALLPLVISQIAVNLAIKHIISDNDLNVSIAIHSVLLIIVLLVVKIVGKILAENYV